MARIIGGIGTSHTPTIGFALDAKKQADPEWAPIFEAYAPLKAWLGLLALQVQATRALDQMRRPSLPRDRRGGDSDEPDSRYL